MEDFHDVNGTQPMEINHMQNVAQQAVNNGPVIQRLIPDERYVPGKRISLSQVLCSLSNVPIIGLISSILSAKTSSVISQSKM